MLDLIRYTCTKFDPEGWNDIGYSFLIGEDARVYEGRGWGVEGAHTRGYNDKAYAASFIGTFETTLPNRTALETAQKFLQCAKNDMVNL